MGFDKIKLARSLLEKRVKNNQVLSYREFATALNLTQAPVIAQCAEILEILLRQDVAKQRPIISAMVVQQGRARIPRGGFFQLLKELNVYEGVEFGQIATQWHQQEIVKLQKFYSLGKNEK